jgi:excisionase family DNA binding protein
MTAGSDKKRSSTQEERQNTSDQIRNVLPIVVEAPFLTPEMLAELTGIGQRGKRIVQGWIDRGAIPSVKVGKHVVVPTRELREHLSKLLGERS